MDETNKILHSSLSPSEKKEFEKLKSEIEEETGKVIKINLGDQLKMMRLMNIYI